MKTLILWDKESAFYGNMNLRSQVQTTVLETGSTVETMELDGSKISPCLGCFQCWIKTPGLCIQTNDDANQISEREMQSDVVIFLSKITYGGYSYDLKTFLDRSIPNIAPFFELVAGESHHKMRYLRFPTMMTIGYGQSTAGERDTFISLTERNTRNMRPLRHFAYTLETAEQFAAVLQALQHDLANEAQL